ncbi:MAG: hypothetical protein ACR2OW_14800 [Methyloligellaceae bacterium]
MQDLIRQAKALIESGRTPEEAYKEVTETILDWGICECTGFGSEKPRRGCIDCDGTGILREDELAHALNLGRAWRTKWLRTMRDKLKRFD